MKTKLVTLVALLGVFTASAASGQTATATWSPNAAAYAVTNYTFYGSTAPLTTNNLSMAPVKVAVGTNTTASCAVTTGQWYFAVTAQNAAGTSSPAFASLLVNPPLPPAVTNLSITIQYSVTYQN